MPTLTEELKRIANVPPTEKRHRVDWTDFELDTLYKGAKDLWSRDKKKTMVELVRMAQIALPENRRRHLGGYTNIPESLRERLLSEQIGRLKGGVLPGTPDKPQDPNALRINQLADERDAALKLAEEAEEKLRSARAEIAALDLKLKQVPSERQVLVNLFADVLAEAQRKLRQDTIFGAPALEPKLPYDPNEDRRVRAERREIEQKPQAPRLPKILIAGGLSLDRLERAVKPFENSAKFAFWRDESYDVLKDRAKSADMTFALMGAISHDAVATIMRETRFFQRVANYSDDHLRNFIRNWLEKEWNTP